MTMTTKPTNRLDYFEYKDSHAYTLSELAFKSGHVGDINETNYQSIESVTRDLLGWDVSLELSTLVNDENVKKLWFDFILPKYVEEYVSINSIDIDFNQPIEEETYNAVFGKFWRLFIAKLKSTFSRYSKLVTLYKTNEDNLLKQVESTTDTKTRQNEVPQGSAVDPYDVNYANGSSVGVVTSKTDLATLPQRLAEVRKIWYSIFEEWRDEFEPLFIEE